jgi:hypothetical protein
LGRQRSAARSVPNELRIGWLKLLADDAPPGVAARPEIVPDDLVAERFGPSNGSLSGSGVPLVGVLYSLAPSR